MKRYSEYKNSGIEWIGRIPLEWDVKKVKHVFYRTKSSAKQEDPTVLSLSRDSVKIRDISTNEGQLANSYFDYNPVQIGDFLLNPMDLYSGANCNVSNVEGVISPAYANLRVKNDDIPRYFDYYFKTQYWKMALFAHGKGVSFDNRWTLNNETLMNYYVPYPSLDEQKKITARLDSITTAIDFLIADKQKLIDLLREKQQAVISGTVTKGLDKNVKMKNSDIDWVGDIPAHWQIKKLRHLGLCQNGLSKSGDFFGSGFPFVSYGDVYKNIELPKNASGLVESSNEERENCSVLKGDVFFTRTSETIEDVALTSTCLHTINDATFSGFLIRFRPNTKELYPSFSKYYFRSQLHRAYFVKEMNLVTRASLSQELLKNLPVILPPIEEQEMIAKYLDNEIAHIDTLVKDINEQIKKLKEYRQSVISEVVTGKVAI